MPTTIPTTMTALGQDRYGGPEVHRLGEYPVPTPGDTELLVRVRAVSLNAADTFISAGVPRLVRLAAGLRRPRQPIRGTDVVGIVEAVGAAVEGFAPGDRIVGEGSGTLAQYAVVRAAKAAHVPDTVLDEHAATLPMAGCTAYDALESLRVKPGDRLLVNGAAGGVGHFAVQLAAARGVHVTAVCSHRNVDALKERGAATVVDYTAEDVLARGEMYDAVLDNVGNLSISQWQTITHPGGAIAPNSGFEGPDGGAAGRPVMAVWKNLVSRHRVVSFVSSVTTDKLDVLVAALADGTVNPMVDGLYSLERGVEALARTASRHQRGKVVVTV